MMGDNGQVTTPKENCHVAFEAESARRPSPPSVRHSRPACGAVALLLKWPTVCEMTIRLCRRAVQSMATQRRVAIGLVWAGLLSLGLCVGCTGPPPVEMSLLTGDPCEPPCWQGLTPGQSTEDDVLEFIQSSRFVDTRTVYRAAVSRGGQVVGTSIQWRSTAARSSNVDSNDFAIEGGVLKDMIIYPDYDVTLESLLQRYGPPDKFHVMVTGRHVPLLQVTLFYPSYGFTASLELPVEEPVLQPESTVIQVWYSQAGPLETFIERGISYLGSYLGTTPEQWSEFLRDWQGYGAVEVP